MDGLGGSAWWFVGRSFWRLVDQRASSGIETPMAKAMHVVVRVMSVDRTSAWEALDAAGFLPQDEPGEGDPNLPAGMVKIRIEVLGDHDGDSQAAILHAVEEALNEAGIDWAHHTHGLTIQGGSVNDRWVAVTLDGQPTEVKVLWGPSEDHQAT